MAGPPSKPAEEELVDNQLGLPKETDGEDETPKPKSPALSLNKSAKGSTPRPRPRVSPALSGEKLRRGSRIPSMRSEVSDKELAHKAAVHAAKASTCTAPARKKADTVNKQAKTRGTQGKLAKGKVAKGKVAKGKVAKGKVANGKGKVVKAKASASKPAAGTSSKSAAAKTKELLEDNLKKRAQESHPEQPPPTRRITAKSDNKEKEQEPEVKKLARALSAQVLQALHRANTQDQLNAAGKEGKQPRKEPENEPRELTAEELADESEAKRSKHNRKNRFYRSLSSSLFQHQQDYYSIILPGRFVQIYVRAHAPKQRESPQRL